MNKINLKLQKAVQDQRYSVDLEYYGCSRSSYVLRFCNKFVKACDNLNDAIFEAIIHQDERGLKLLSV